MDFSEDTLSVASAQFGFHLLSALVSRAPRRNVVFSPAGVFSALLPFVFLGDETTRRALRAALGIEAIPDDALQAMYWRTGAHITAMQSPDCELTCATSLWRGSTHEPTPEFAERATQWNVVLFAGASESDTAALAWSKSKVRGLLLPVWGPKESEANLTNAVYFRGAWKSPFDTAETKRRLFHRSNAMPNFARLMRQPAAGTVRLYRGAQFDAARIPYVSGPNHAIALHILLPRRTTTDFFTAKDDTTPLATHFTLTQWNECQSGYKKAVVDLVLPRFQHRETTGLKETLQQMGIAPTFAAEPFEKNTASALTRIEQQTRLAFYENDMAATAPNETPPVSPRPSRDKFYANRPFLFFVTEEASGLFLFAGVIHDPNATRW